MKPIRLVAVLAAGVLALNLCWLTAGTGVAQQADSETLALVNCTGTARQDFDPPLRAFPQHVDLYEVGTLSTCLPNTQNIVNGSFILIGSGLLDCVIGGNSDGVYRIEWVRANGTVAHSFAVYPIISFSVRSTGQTIVVLTASIVDGLFEGHTFLYEEVLLQFDVARCLLGPGVSTVGGPVNLTVL